MFWISWILVLRSDLTGQTSVLFQQLESQNFEKRKRLQKGIDTTIWHMSNFGLSNGVFSAVTLLVGRVFLVNENKNSNLSVFSNVDLTVQKMQKLLLIFTFLSTIKLFFQVLVVMLVFSFFSLDL